MPIDEDNPESGRLFFSIVLSLIAGLVFGVAPALKASRPGLVPALKEASSESNAG